MASTPSVQNPPACFTVMTVAEMSTTTTATTTTATTTPTVAVWGSLWWWRWWVVVVVVMPVTMSLQYGGGGGGGGGLYAQRGPSGSPVTNTTSAGGSNVSQATTDAYYRTPDVPELMHVIASLGWEQIAIFHDSSSDVVAVVNRLLPELHEAHVLTSEEEEGEEEEGGGGVGQGPQGVRAAVAPYQQLREDFIPVHRHFLVLGSPRYVLGLLWEMAQVAQPNQTSPFLYLTQWLTAVPGPWLQPLQSLVQHFENLAVFVPSQSCALTLWTLRREGEEGVFSVVGSLVFPPLPAPLTRDVIFPNPLFGLGGRNIRVVVKELNIYSVVKRNDSGRVYYEGVSIDLLNELSVRANFTYTLLHAPPDGSFGQELDNGEWDGPIGMLTRQEADLAVGYFSLTSERKAVADATSPYFIENAAIVFRKESLKELPDYLSFFLHPFQTLIYVVVLVSLVLVLLLLMTMECWRMLLLPGGGGGGVVGGGGAGAGGGGGGGRRGVPGRASAVTALIVDDLEILVAGLLKQSFDTRRILSRAGAVLVMSWWLFALVLTSVYSSQLTSTLTVVPRSLPFTSMEQLIQQDTYVWGVMGGTAMETMLQNSNIQVFQDYYQGVLNFAKTDPMVLSPDLEVHNNRVLQGHYAHFVFFDSELNKLLALDCRVAQIPEPYVTIPFVFYLQKGCPYTSLLSRHIERIVAAGLVTVWRKRWLPTNPECGVVEHTSRAIEVTDTQSAFYMAAIGLLAAGGLLTLERLYLSYTQLDSRRCTLPVPQLPRRVARHPPGPTPTPVGGEGYVFDTGLTFEPGCSKL
ncbi:glutamate receptor ionotropic, delta-1-like [Babylonia areolata]|uniref:glutamate receptor ionotropic, delta-1-like n=1 Tax=Babylonia areolata TaxID=304850 RepID=UPI003FD648E9